MKRVIVLGGAGFVGSHLTRALLAEPGVERVTVYDNLSSGRAENVPQDERVRHLYRDIKHYPHLKEAMADHDTVFMLAANPDISKAVTEPDIDFREGTVLMQNVLEAMRENDVSRIFYFSGSGVYGENSGLAFTENHGPCQPISTYGASKLACEAMISAYCHMFGFAARVFRPANIVGPRQTHGVGFDFIRRLKDNPSTLRILGDGTQFKSYIHISDVLDAVWLTMNDWGHRYKVFNVATDDAMTVTQIALLATYLLHIESCDFQHTPGDRGWKGDVPVIRLNCDRIRALGWNPKMGSAAAMTAALRAML